MAEGRQVYGEVSSKTDLKHVFQAIRGNVDKARSRESLTELHKRAGYLIALTHAPSWKESFGRKASDLRKTAEAEFSTTARKINRQAKAIGTDANYDEKWGD